VLVVDDNEDIREVLGSFLATLDYRADVAFDGQQALELFRSHVYDVLICDLQMPRLEGLSLLEQVKAIDPGAVVIILTGNGTLETAVKAMRLGAYDYLLKPVEDMGAFGRLVEQAYKQRMLVVENRRLVAELQKANARLETEVAVRTAELQIANESLRSLDKLKNDFVSVVSHELRTPLSVIALEAQLLLTERDVLPPDKLQGIYETLLLNTRRLQIQIDNLLDFALIERGQLELNLSSCSVNRIVREAIDLYEARATEKNLKFSLNLLPTSQLAVIVDGPRLRSALIQLVDNALKFTPDGGVITIGVHGMVMLPGTEIPAAAISVRDTGIGIEPEVQQKLFTAFSQGDMSATRRHGGMGIGLALAARIVEAHGGRITFKSELGHGSLFVIWVPVKPQPVAHGKITELIATPAP
jgi:signal transduction histidine kinase